MTSATDDYDIETRSTGGGTAAVDERDCRALTETMFVRCDAPDLYEVRTSSGGEYTVDLREPACTCPDFQYRDIACKHIRRVRLETGDRDVDALAAEIDEALCEIDDRIAALAGRRAEFVTLQSAVARFENR